jgi:predicted metal-dependent HD superfamily phosphohydrolase
MEIESLETRWMKRFSCTNKAETIIKNGFKHLATKYSEKHRHYHTLQHVDACMKHLDEIAGHIVDLKAVEIALWFHDMIYDPKRNDNEKRSAKYAEAFLASVNLPPEEISKIAKLVVLTKHPSHPSSNDEKYLIDIDLAILGANEQRYDQYESSIRKEYGFVPSLLYKKGRRKLLLSFAESDRIYLTADFYKKYENQARLNIHRALKNLK